MVYFLELPRELRDLVYTQTINEVPLSIQSPHFPVTVVNSIEAQGLIQANQQISSEYLHMLKQHASLAHCFDKTSIHSQATHPDPTAAHRARKLFLVIDLTDIKHTDWDPKKPEEAINETLLQLITHVQDFIAGFRNLGEIEIQWWVDLSVAQSTVNLGLWTRALTDVGLVDSRELWYGYLGGIVKDMAKLRKHLVDMRKGNTKRQARMVGREGFKLLRGHT